MNRLLILAILIISTEPLCAQGKHRKAVAVEPLPMCGSFQKRFVAWIKANP
jgi:hypothetical protein